MMVSKAAYVMPTAISNVLLKLQLIALCTSLLHP